MKNSDFKDQLSTYGISLAVFFYMKHQICLLDFILKSILCQQSEIEDVSKI